MPKNNKGSGKKSTTRKNRTSLTKPQPKQNIQSSQTISAQTEVNPSHIPDDTNFANRAEQSKPIETNPIPASQPRQVLLTLNDEFFKKELIRIALFGGITTLMLVIISFTIKSN